MLQDPSSSARPQDKPAHGKAPLPVATGSLGSPKHASVSCRMGLGLWFPGAGPAGATARTHTPPAQRGLLTASAGPRAPGLPTWDSAGRDRPPRVSMGRPDSTAAAGPGLCPGGRGGPGTGNMEATGLGGVWGLEQAAGTPVLQQSPSEVRHVALLPVRCEDTPIALRRGLHPHPAQPRSPPGSTAVWNTLGPAAGSGPCGTGVKPPPAATCRHGDGHSPALAPCTVPPCHAPGSCLGQFHPLQEHAAPRTAAWPPSHPAEAEGVGLVPGDPVVSDERVSEHQDLRLVGGVGEGLGVAHHAGLEDCERRERGWGRLGRNVPAAPRPAGGGIRAPDEAETPPPTAPRVSPRSCPTAGRRAGGGGVPVPGPSPAGDARRARAAPRHPLPSRTWSRSGPARPHSPTSPAAAAPAAPKGRPRSTDPSCSTRHPMAAPRALRRLRGGYRARRMQRSGGGGRIRGGAGPGQPPRRGGVERRRGDTRRLHRSTPGSPAARRAGPQRRPGRGPGGSIACSDPGPKTEAAGEERSADSRDPRRQRPERNQP